jgi:predicted nucleic acid-binding protein
MSKTTLDSNILIYAFGKQDDKKKEIAKGIISDCEIVSLQAINETLFVLYAKFKFPVIELETVKNFLVQVFNISEINTSTLSKSLQIMKKYNYSFWDSMMIASALNNQCQTLYSEDMHHGQIIEDKLEIINPFLESM